MTISYLNNQYVPSNTGTKCDYDPVNNILYIADGTTLKALSYSNSGYTVLGSVTVGDSIRSLRYKNGRIFIVYGDTPSTLRIYTFDGANFHLVTSSDTSTIGHIIWYDVDTNDDSTVVFLCGFNHIYGGALYVLLFDGSNLTSPMNNYLTYTNYFITLIKYYNGVLFCLENLANIVAFTIDADGFTNVAFCAIGTHENNLQYLEIVNNRIFINGKVFSYNGTGTISLIGTIQTSGNLSISMRYLFGLVISACDDGLYTYTYNFDNDTFLLKDSYTNHGFINFSIDKYGLFHGSTFVGKSIQAFDLGIVQSVNFIAAPLVAQTMQLINFTNLSQGCNNSIWNFGDGSSSVEFSPTKYYTAPGIYTITLSVNGILGEAQEKTRVAYIIIIPKESNLFIEQFKKTNSIPRLLIPFILEMQELQQVFTDLKLLRAISTATGKQLDNISDIRRITGQSDTDYRAAIQLHIKMITSPSDPDTIINNLQYFLNAGVCTIDHDEPAPATISIHANTTTTASSSAVNNVKQLNEIKGAGIALFVSLNDLTPLHIINDDSSTPSRGLGLSEMSSLYQGGQIAERIL